MIKSIYGDSGRLLENISSFKNSTWVEIVKAVDQVRGLDIFSTSF